MLNNEPKQDLSLEIILYNKNNENEVKNKENQVTINSIAIPKEIIQMIFAYLTPKELVTASLVCKAWKQFSLEDIVWSPHTPRCPPSLSDKIQTCHEIYNKAVLKLLNQWTYPPKLMKSAHVDSFYADSKYLIYVEKPNINIYDFSGQEIHQWPVAYHLTLAIQPCKDLIALCDPDTRQGNITVFSLAGEEKYQCSLGEMLSFLLFNQSFLIAIGFSKIKIFNSKDGLEIFSTNIDHKDYYSNAELINDRFLLLRTEGKIKPFDLEKKIFLNDLTLNNFYAFDPASTLLATINDSQQRIEIWDWQANKLLYTLKEQQKTNFLKFIKNELIIGSLDGKVKIWDYRAQTCPPEFNFGELRAKHISKLSEEISQEISQIKLTPEEISHRLVGAEINEPLLIVFDKDIHVWQRYTKKKLYHTFTESLQTSPPRKVKVYGNFLVQLASDHQMTIQQFDETKEVT